MTSTNTGVLTILKELRPENDFMKSGNFLVDGMLDSFDIVALVSALDSHFNIAIDGVEIVPENFESLDAIQKLLARYGAQV